MESVCVLNLRNGRNRCPVSQQPQVSGFGLTPAGSLAWLEQGRDARFYVGKLERGSRNPVVLDSGTDIDPTSFAAAGHFIYWTKAGQPQSARMP